MICVFQEADSLARRADHKRKQLVYKRWLKFSKFVIIKSYLKRKYNFNDVKLNENDGPSEKVMK